MVCALTFYVIWLITVVHIHKHQIEHLQAKVYEYILTQLTANSHDLKGNIVQRNGNIGGIELCNHRQM